MPKSIFNTLYKKLLFVLLVFGMSNICCMQLTKNMLQKSCNYLSNKTASCFNFLKEKITNHYRKKAGLEGELKDASQETKNEMIMLAKKLGIKNSEAIKVKILDVNYKTAGMNSFGKTMILSKDINEDIKNNQHKFIIAHELNHYKHNDSLKGILTYGITCTILGSAYYYGLKKLPKYLSPFGNQNDSLTKSEILYLLFALGGPLGIPKFSSILTNFTTDRYIEKRADLSTASLGEDIAQGGIETFTQENNKRKLACKARNAKIAQSPPLKRLFIKAWSRLSSIYRTIMHPDEHLPQAFKKAKYGKQKQKSPLNKKTKKEYKKEF